MFSLPNWGLSSNDYKGGIYYIESDKWAGFFREHNISWCNYAIGSHVNNDANALNLISDKYTDEQKASHWPDGLLSKSGSYAREKILDGKASADTEETSGTTEPSAST